MKKAIISTVFIYMLTFYQLESVTPNALIAKFPFLKSTFAHRDLTELCPLFEFFTNPEDVKKLVATLKRIPRMRQKEAIDHAIFLTNAMTFNEFTSKPDTLINFIGFLGPLPKQCQEEIVRSAQILIPIGLTTSVLRDLEKIPVGKRQEVTQRLKGFIADKRRYKLKKVDIIRLLHKVKSIPTHEWEDLSEGLTLLPKQAPVTDIISIIHTLQKIPIRGRRQIIENYSQLLTSISDQERDEWGQIYLRTDQVLRALEVLAKIPIDERKDVHKSIKVLLGQKCVHFEGVIQIIQAVTAIPRSERHEIITIYRRFLDDSALDDSALDDSALFSLNPWNVSDALTALMTTPQAEREEVAWGTREVVIQQAPEPSFSLFGNPRPIDGFDLCSRRRSPTVVANVFKLLKATPANLRSQLIHVLSGAYRFEPFYLTLMYLDVETRVFYIREFVQRYIRIEAGLRQDQQIDFNELLQRVRDDVTQQRVLASPIFHEGVAFQIHNATKSLVTFSGHSVSGYSVYQAHKGIEKILLDLNVQRLPLGDCLCEMLQIPGLDDIDNVRRVLAAGYPMKTERLIYVNEVTPLLSLVWPYMKQQSVELQRTWLNLAISESATAYGSGQFSLSCPKGIQERLTVTGWEVVLEGVDRRLIGIATLAKTLATDVFGILQAGLRVLQKSDYQAILTLETLTRDNVHELFDKALRAYATQNQALHVEGLQLVDDFTNNSRLKMKLKEFEDFYVDPSYEKLTELKGIAREKLEEFDKERGQ